MPKRYPLLTLEEVVTILTVNGFTHTGTRGSHRQFEKGSFKVTVDDHAAPFDAFLIKSMIRQSGLSREEFYCSTRSTAKKINKKARKHFDS